MRLSKRTELKTESTVPKKLRRNAMVESNIEVVPEL